MCIRDSTRPEPRAARGTARRCKGQPARNTGGQPLAQAGGAKQNWTQTLGRTLVPALAPPGTARSRAPP
eukprot:6797698-Lingulodinium_polyedra.AAC.1